MRYRDIGDRRVSLTVSDICLGIMNFGYRTDERTAAHILDRFVDAGGTFVDTANNYGQWHGEAGESERVLGRWLASRPAGDNMVVATKVGARTLKPGDPSQEYWQGLGREHIRTDAETSRRNLGRDRLDLYYAHIDDRSTPQEETVDALAELAESGTVGLLGCSNTALWRIERARGIARAAGRPAYSCVQQRHSYLLPLPGPGQQSPWQPPRRPGHYNLITEELIDYAEADNLTLLAYSPLLGGLYPRGERPSGEYAHAANDERLAVLAEVARELNATTSQVVLAWLLASRPSIIPIIGASSVAQLNELLGALNVTLDKETMARLDAAGRHRPE
jgi:aryl-alcohol dehydrogenase-like predicted oxidoreductase